MSREPYEGKKGFSPAQRKACVVLALCALAIVLSILAAWVLPAKLGLFAGGAGAYDKDAYPLDTSLEAVLPQAAADDAYITASVFAGDQYAVTLQKDGRITLNQFVGQEGLKTSKALSTSCVNFASDSSNYTIPQAIPKMKARRVFVQLGANDVDGSVSVDSFIADYKQFLQSIRSAYSYCDIIAVGIPPVTEDSTNAAATQTVIDQFNQAIAVACNDLGCKYLNSAEVLKNSRGYAESSYFEANGYSASGARALLEYAKSHAYNTMDSRPDTSDIPQRASQSSGSGSTPLPTATPTASPTSPPSPTPAVTQTPEPVVTPEPITTPEPTQEPVITPEPEPTGTPEPVITAEPAPDPEPPQETEPASEAPTEVPAQEPEAPQE